MIPPEFLHIFAAFGLSAAAGFNAWATLFIVSLAARFGWLTLSTPYDVMASDPVVGGLFILMLIEGLADKVPGVDHLSHLVHTVLQPAAGAILFASQANVITQTAPFLAFFVGALVSGGIHGARTLFRPVVTMTTAGHGNPLVSLAEDVAAVALSAASILMPVLVLAASVTVPIAAILLWKNQHAVRR
ncbi:MAG: DUF4126 domain-containing protein [Chloroflexi bacterium]|nr:DUF4126 domain-containing protein [Chloroflexota bacterium]